VTRDDVNRTLRMMETCRMMSYEADTKTEERRLNRQYNQMWKSIKPYIDGKRPYTDAPSLFSPTAAP
jgi:hypothetical protein